MQRHLRPLAVFGIASGVSMAAALQLLVDGAHGSEQPSYGVSFFSGYDLAKLDLLEPTLYNIEETYVEPARIDWERMYVAALEAVERRVPACMFSREPGGGMLSVEVGAHRTVLEVPLVGTRRELQDQLKRIASLLDAHLEPGDVPVNDIEYDPKSEVEYALINGVLSTLDPHSVLLPPPESEEMDVENRGEFGGLGINIQEDDGKLIIESPLRGTPAEAAGLLPDDQIVRIDGESTINMSLSEAVKKLRGPVDAPVVIEIARDGEPEPLPVRIVRKWIKLHPVEGDLLDGGIGYVSIKSFHQNVAGDLHATLNQLHREAGGQLRGLVLDLRKNPGGYLSQAVSVANTFLDYGNIVSTVDGNGRKRDSEEAKARGTEPEYPIAVLVDANSASASEIVAGALRNNDRAVIIGERTFGKGSVQNLHAFYDDSKLKLTISKYLTPGDRSIQSVGIPADIRLVPTRVKVDDRSELKEVSLYQRDRVRREADLDKHLERVALDAESAAYRLRYLEPNAKNRRSARLEAQSDYQVQFARDVLLSARSHRRAEILASCGPVVRSHRIRGEREIEDALREIDIDWRDGPVAPRLASGKLPVDLTFDLGPDHQLVAGQREVVTLSVTNTSDKPLYRLVAVATENEILDGREFVFGRLEPGETRDYRHLVSLVDGHPAERAPVTFTLYDGSDEPLGTTSAEVPVHGNALPRLEWSWRVTDSEGGDGDGVAEVGEVLDIELDVVNAGDGPTAEAFARISNRAGRALDIVVGNLSLGELRSEDGTLCPPEPSEAEESAGEPGVSEEEHGEQCRNAIAAGERWSGAFRVQIKEAPEAGEALGLELTLGDQRAYDHGSIVRGGFYSYFAQEEQLELEVGAPLPVGALRSPPRITITRRPGAVSTDGRATLSGSVHDDEGLAHVMVYAGDDKVFYQGAGNGAAVRFVPFTADVALESGESNVLSVLATDKDGFKGTASVVTWHMPSDLAQATRAEGE